MGLTLLAFIAFFAMLEGLLLSVALLAIATIKFANKMCCKVQLPLHARKKKVSGNQIRPAMGKVELQATRIA